MKRILITLLAAAMVSSCFYFDPYENTFTKRNANNIALFSESLCTPASLYPAVAVRVALHLDDYLKQSEEGRKDSRFSDIVPGGDGIFEISTFGTFTTGGKQLDEQGACWKFQHFQRNSRPNPAEFAYELTASYGGWTVNGTLTEDKKRIQSFIKAKSLEFSTRVSRVENDGISWTITFQGTYEENDGGFSASFRNSGIIILREVTSSSADAYQVVTTTSLQMSGAAEVSLYKENKELDWCKVSWNDDRVSYETSQGDING